MTNTKLTLLLIIALSFYANLLRAQNQTETYQKAIDQINCATAKKMLTSFERAFLAKNITDCRYETIVREVKKIQENQTKGYKQDILNITSKINDRKNSIENPSEYVVFETSLDDLALYVEEQYAALCGKYRKPTNNVCKDYEKSNQQLQQEISNIVNKALVQIGKNTYGGEKAKDRQPLPPPTSTTGIATPSETESTNQPTTATPTSATPDKTRTSGSDNNLAALISTIVLVLLIAAVGWLYKEQQELKEQLEDIRMMLKVYNRKENR